MDPQNPLLTLLLSTLLLSLTLPISSFQSDELLLDDEEFEGGQSRSLPSNPIPTIKKRSSSIPDLDSDSKVQFQLDHKFGDSSEFRHAGVFTARLKTLYHGGQSLTKLRFSRNSLTDLEHEHFKELLKNDEFYTIRLPSNVLSPPGKDYIISSVKARCLAKDSLDEHFIIHMDGVNILGVNYGSPGACPYPRPLRLPTKWSFNSYTLLKSTELAARAPAFTEDILGGTGEIGEGELVPPPERSFWAKYWMYMIPLGLVVVNAVTQAMNMPEEQAAGQTGQAPQSAVQRAPNPAVRRR